MTVPLSLTHGTAYTVLPKRLISGNWVANHSDGVEPGGLTYRGATGVCARPRCM